uniref:CCHC-type domain-containing protein n=1 Tax=Xiphophorus maculatus TaxID=8083 RepID=A0A3B5QSM6_XIPMA
MELSKNKRTDPSVLDNLERNTETSFEQVKMTGVFEKENTVQIEVVGDEKISVLDLMKNIRFLCGGLLACRVLSAKKFEITLSNEKAKKRLLDGFKMGSSTIHAKELINDELVVSFLTLPAYITDEEILSKLHTWGVKAVSEIKRRVWPGTKIADGTRFVKVKFTETVQSLPYSARFNTALGPEYFRVIHDRQVKVCRICLQPGHIVRDCPDFCCHFCGVQGHYVRECSEKKQEKKCQICQNQIDKCICNLSESDDQDQGLTADFKEADTQSGEESEMEGEVEENEQVEGGEEELSECMPSAEWSVARAPDAEVSGALAMGEVSKNGKNTVEEEREEVAAPLPPVAEGNSQLLSPAHLPSFQTPLSALPRTLKIVDYVESDPDLDLTKIIQTRKRLASLATKPKRKAKK